MKKPVSDDAGFLSEAVCLLTESNLLVIPAKRCESIALSRDPSC